MIERVVRFGAAQHLTGILFDGSGDETSSANVGVVMLNAGLMPRTGPFQMHTQLARFLARQRIVSLRFDLSGLGDSEACHLASNSREQQIADVLAAVDFLKRKGHCDKVVLLGLCSGAYLSHAVAVRDSAIDGCVFLDGFAFHTNSYFFEQRIMRLLRPRKWITIARRIGSSIRNVGSTTENAASDDDFFEESTPPADQLRTEVAHLLARDAKLQFIYTGGTTESFASEKQFAEMFGDLNGFAQIDFHFLPHADHTYSLWEDRQHMFGLVQNFLNQHFIPVVGKRDESNTVLATSDPKPATDPRQQSVNPTTP